MTVPRGRPAGAVTSGRIVLSPDAAARTLGVYGWRQ